MADKARERINNLLDSNSFVELGADITARSTDFNSSEPKEANDGVITGLGLIDERLVFVYSQDASVLNGTIGEMHANKILNLYEKALKMGAPIIGFIDCGGVRLYEAMDGMEAIGKMINAASKASGVVPQILSICGKCGGALNVFASLNDYVVMSNEGALFVNSPDAISGNRKELIDSSSANFQFENGNVDMICDEDDMSVLIRNYIDMIPNNNVDGIFGQESFDDLNRSTSGLEDMLGNMNEFISQIADDNIFVEMKSGIGSMKTGLIKMNGQTVGVVANEENDESSRLTSKGVKKATDFINYCDAFSIPILTFTNVNGFETEIETEVELGNDIAKMCLALSDADVPKINIIIGDAVGSGYLFMNSKALGADLVYAFDNSNMAVMDGNMAAKIICSDSELDENEVYNNFVKTNSGVGNAARRGYVDKIINSIDTRKYIIAGFEMLFTKNEYFAMKKHNAK